MPKEETEIIIVFTCYSGWDRSEDSNIADGARKFQVIDNSTCHQRTTGARATVSAGKITIVKP